MQAVWGLGVVLLLWVWGLLTTAGTFGSPATGPRAAEALLLFSIAGTSDLVSTSDGS